MAVEELLLDYLDELCDEEFERFKWYLMNLDLDGIKQIPKSHLEKAKRTDTVSKVIHNYSEGGALKATLIILKKLRRNDLAEKLSKEMAELPSPTSSTSALMPAAGPSIVAQGGSVVIAPNLNNSSDRGTWNININKE